MFYNCSALNNFPDISNWNISNVINLSNMFYGCESLEKLRFSEWKTNKVKNMSYMFAECKNLEIEGLINWDTENVRFMNNMFENCLNINNFSFLSKWNLKNDVDISEIFDGIKEEVERPKWYQKKINDD